MRSSRAVQTLILMPDPRQTPLGELGGAAFGRASYTPYGHAEPNRLAARTGFNGQLREPPGWYQLGNGHRVYNPALMRFHNPDRLSPFDRGGLNAYAYCQGDPVNFVDPTGRFAEIGAFLQDTFLDKPAFGLILNVGLFVVNLGGAVISPPVGAGLWAARAGVLGAAGGAVGSAMHLAGKEEGKWVSLAGTVLSAVAASLRANDVIDTIRKRYRELKGDLGQRLRYLVIGGKRPPGLAAVNPKPSMTSPAAVRKGSMEPVVNKRLSNVAQAARNDSQGSLQSLSEARKGVENLKNKMRRESEVMRGWGIPSSSQSNQPVPSAPIP